LVLEREATGGSARASFALAETYDPRMLSSWRTIGVRGNPAKARELYQRAYEGGIPEARRRADALK
jgi:TPR repeat protein